MPSCNLWSQPSFRRDRNRYICVRYHQAYVHYPSWSLVPSKNEHALKSDLSTFWACCTARLSDPTIDRGDRSSSETVIRQSNGRGGHIGYSIFMGSCNNTHGHKLGALQHRGGAERSDYLQKGQRGGNILIQEKFEGPERAAHTRGYPKLAYRLIPKHKNSIHGSGLSPKQCAKPPRGKC